MLTIARRKVFATLSVAAGFAAATNTAAAQAPVPCPAGAVCEAIDQPSVPAWLALANGKAYFTSQRFEGVVADEYGSTLDADGVMYSKSVRYEHAPALGARVVDAVLADLDGHDSGGTNAFVLQANRTLSVLGPQMDGYPRRAADVTVPGTGELVGVTALTSAGGNRRVIVVAQDGFYLYDWVAGQLALQPSMPTRQLPLAPRAFLDYDPDQDPAFGNAGGGFPLPGGPPFFKVPDGERIVGMYQAAPGKATIAQATSTFALAYTGTTSSIRGPGPGSYSIALFGLADDGLHALNHFQSAAPDASGAPIAVRYAAAEGLLHLSTVATSTSGPPRMTTWDATFAGAYTSPLSPTLVGGVSAVICPRAEGNALPALDAGISAIPDIGAGSRILGTTASVCASPTGDPARPLRFLAQRGDMVRAASAGVPDIIHSLSESPADLALPPGVQLAAVSLSFPCAQVLKRFVEKPLNGFPDVSANPQYCLNHSTPETVVSQPSTGREMAPRSSLAVHVQTLATDASGDASLNLSSVSYQMPGACIGAAGTNQIGCSNDQPLTNTTQRLLDVDPGASDFKLLPLDPSGVILHARILTDASHQVIRVPAARNPAPVALMAAPPYYAGGEQQVTPTSTTFRSAACQGSSTTARNQVGIFGGLSLEWADGKYEVEALVKLSLEWNHTVGQETCTGWEQQYQAGNFGNNYVADNSLLYRVDSGVHTYGEVIKSSLGVNLTRDCDANRLANCHALFVPTGSQYVLQTLNQIKHPQPNNIYAELNDELESKFGPALEQALPDAGNPLSYPKEAASPPVGGNACDGPAVGPGSGNAGIKSPNPFVAPSLPPRPNVLMAPQATAVNPASFGDEAGTVSTLTYDSSVEESSSTEFTLGGEASVKIVAVKFGASYEHGWGTETRQSFSDGTTFSGGVNDFQGFFNPYTYRLYQCRGSLALSPSWGDASVPVFMVNYMTRLVADQLPLNFVVPDLPTGTVDQEYKASVFASGGVPDYTYSLADGALPPGLSLNPSTGRIAGTPTADGTFAATVRAVDRAGNAAAEDIEIEVLERLAMLDTLPPGDVGVRYDSSLGVTGGVAPYKYLRTQHGNVPPGLSINNSSGRLQGTPTAAGTFCFGVYVTDKNFPNATITARPCVTISSAPAITPGASLPLGEVGRPYDGSVCCVSGGSAPYTWSVSNLPAGLSLDAATGAITGTPTVATTTSGVDLAPAVRDVAGGEATGGANLRILPAPAITTATLPSGRVGETYAPLVEVAGGDGANTFALVGTAPPGLALGAASGRFAGAPTTAGTYTFTIRATDGLGGVAERSYTVRVDPAGGPAAPEITSAAGETAAEGAPLAFRVTTSGSPAPAITLTGALPAGVRLVDNHDGSATLGGIPAVGAAGAYPLTLRAENGIAPAATQAFTLTVTPALSPVPGVAATYVANAGADAVTVYAAGATGDAAPVARLAGPATKLDEPSGVALDAAGNLYVANAGNGTVTQYAPGAGGDTAPIATLSGASFTGAGGLVVAGDGTLYVATSGAIRAVRGTTVSTIANPGTPVAVALDLAGNVFSANAAAKSVTAYAAGTHAALGSLSGSGSGLAGPTGVAVDPAGQLFVSDGDEVKHYAPGATGSVPPLLTIGGPASGLSAPTDVALDPAGNVLVTDAGNDSLTTYGGFAGGASLRTIAGPHTGLADPSALFVAAAPWVRTQPSAGPVVDPGGRIVLSTAISASPACPLRWQRSTSAGAPFVDVPGATAPTLVLDPVLQTHDGYRYRAACANSFGSVVTGEAVVSVRSAAAIAADPSDVTVVAGASARFTAEGRGHPAPAVQWQRSTDGGASFTDVAGATAATLDVPAVPASANGDRYRAVFTNAAGSATTAAARLIVHFAPAISAQPADLDAVPGQPARFTASAAGNPAPAAKWQISTDGGLSFADMNGATGATLTIPRTSSVHEGYQFRAVFTNAVGSATSDPATLSVASAPAVVQNPTDVSVAAGDAAGFTALATGSPAPAVQWQVSRDGGATYADIPGETGGDLVVASAPLSADGSRYRARFSNLAGTAYSRGARLSVRRADGNVISNSTIAGTNIVAGSIVSNSSPAAFVKIRSATLGVARTGRRARDVRIKLYCEPKAGRDCTGTVKIRTSRPVNPSTTGRRAKPKRVTFVTFAYSLPRGAVGIATGRLSTEKMTLLRRLRTVKVDAFVQVTDVQGRALVVRRTLAMKTVRKSG